MGNTGTFCYNVYYARGPLCPLKNAEENEKMLIYVIDGATILETEQIVQYGFKLKSHGTFYLPVQEIAYILKVGEQRHGARQLGQLLTG